MEWWDRPYKKESPAVGLVASKATLGGKAIINVTCYLDTIGVPAQDLLQSGMFPQAFDELSVRDLIGR